MIAIITMVLDMTEDQSEDVFGDSGDVDLLINPDYYDKAYSINVEFEDVFGDSSDMECDMCGDDGNVGFAGCEHEECKTIKVCDLCDVDGSNYNGWCIDEHEKS